MRSRACRGWKRRQNCGAAARNARKDREVPSGIIGGLRPIRVRVAGYRTNMIHYLFSPRKNRRVLHCQSAVESAGYAKFLLHCGMAHGLLCMSHRHRPGRGVRGRVLTRKLN